MSKINKIDYLGTSYDIEDAQARNDLASISTKLSYIGKQIDGDISGNTITFEDDVIGGNYLLDVYCSDTDRYIDTQTISGNTMTVVCDETIASGSIAVCIATKKKGV